MSSTMHAWTLVMNYRNPFRIDLFIIYYIYSKVRNMWHSFEMEHSTNPAPRYRRRRHHVHAPPRSKIPKSDRFVLRPAHEHRASPIVQGEHVSAVTAQRLEGGACGAIGDVDLAITGTAADQQTRLVRGIFQKAQIANRAVVHRKLHFLTWKERNRKKNKGFYFFFFFFKELCHARII